MISYKKLPVGTPQWVTLAILLLGGALGISISVYGFITLYGLSAFLINLFFPTANFAIDSNEAIYLGLVGLSAGLSTTLLGYLGVYMNGLSRRAIRLSGIVWLPLLITTGLVIADTTISTFLYRFTPIWISGAILSLVLGGLLPWLLLRHPAARQVHSR